MKEPVQIFKCPCEGHKYKMAGKPNENPTHQEKMDIAALITAGCTVQVIPIEQFREEKWQYCPKHFEKK